MDGLQTNISQERSEGPSGTVTFLFTDIEGSTRLLEQLREAYAIILDEHRQILHDSFKHWEGREIDTQGDACFVAFSRAIDAVCCALEAQHILAEHKWPHEVTVRVRMGLHTGEPIVVRTGYVGMDVHLAARIAAAGYGGQVLLSQTTRDLVFQDLPKGATLRDLGSHVLKDIRYPQQIYQLDIQGLPTEFPLLKTLSAEVEPPTPGEAPYKGLQYFDETDAEWFFGRAETTDRLVKAVQSQRFLAVIGASGSGKSSVVRAGLVPALKHGQPERWEIHIIAPTAHPLDSLAVSLTRETKSVIDTTTLTDDLHRDPRCLHMFIQRKLMDSKEKRLLLVVDQFEELFTLCRDEEERWAFVDNLLVAVETEGGATTVLLALRADFYDRLAQYAGLREMVAKQQEYLGAMTSEELRQAIEEPARRGGWEFSPGLVELMLHDIGAEGDRQPEPGALPLLSHALLETWKRRRGILMNLRAYSEAGGVRGAIARTADSVYSRDLSPAQQEIARSIFLRLTELGEGTQDTRRRAEISELIPPAPYGDPEKVEEVLHILADARLITTSQGFAEVAHEALIREWPALREWLAADREGLRVHRRMTEATQEWELLEHDPGALYRGAHLAQALEWAQTNPRQINAQEQVFLEASQEAAQREAAEREAQRQRELKAAQTLAETQTQAAQRLRRRLVYLLAALVMAGVLAIAAVFFGQQANQNARLASQNLATAQIASTNAVAQRVTAQIASTYAVAQQVTAEANFLVSERVRLAAEATNLVSAESNASGELPALLALRSLELGYSPQAHAALMQATQRGFVWKRFPSQGSNLTVAAYSPDGKYIATVMGNSTINLWEVQAGELVRQFTSHQDIVNDLSFTPDDAYLITASSDKTLRLWDLQSGEELRQYTGHTDIIESVAVSPDGRYALSTSDDLTARLWDIQTSENPVTYTGHTDRVMDGTFLPDGKTLLTVGTDRTLRFWDAMSGSELRVITTTHTTSINAIAISPDGTLALTSPPEDMEGTVILWDLARGAELRRYPYPHGSQGIFSPDGQNILITDYDYALHVFDTASGNLLRSFKGVSGMLHTTVFSPDGKYIFADGPAGVGLILDFRLETEPLILREISTLIYLGGVVYSPDGRYVLSAIQYGSEDAADVRMWDTLTGHPVKSFKGHTDQVMNVDISSDGSKILTASFDGTARLWDIQTGQQLQTFVGHEGIVWNAIFSPDGQKVLTSGDDLTARLWDSETGAEIRQFTGHTADIAFLDFSADGQTFVTGSWDDTARIWDVQSGQEIQRFDCDQGAVNTAKYSPNQKLLLTTGADGTLKLWEVATGKLVLTMHGHTAPVYYADFSPDGKYIISTSPDRSIRLWEVDTGQEVSRYLGYDQGILGVSFAPDGKTFVSNGVADGTTRIWRVDYRDVMQWVCSILPRDLTPEERQQFLIQDSLPTCP